MAPRDLTIREISDRIRIHDLLARYATAIDTRDWPLLDTCFTPDARLDYTSSGGVKGDYPAVRAWLEKALAAFPAGLHLIGNTRLALDGDAARARTYLINPMGFPRPDGSLHVFTVCAIYSDRLVHGADGWRIAERIEEQVLLDGSLPAALEVPR